MTGPELTPPNSGSAIPDPFGLGGAHVWFTTRGAVDASGGGYDHLNLGAHVGDDPERVARNRRALDEAVGTPVHYVSQVHGVGVHVVSGPPDRDGALVEADAIVLDGRGTAGTSAPVAGAIMVADCVPLALASTDGRLAAVVHAGRAGMLAGVLEVTLGTMARLDPATARPGGLHGAIGPSICGACYEVSAEIHADVLAREPAAAATSRDGTCAVDVAAGVRAQLSRLRPDVRLDARAERCTYESADLYSHRRATHAAAPGLPARTGRFTVVVRTA